MMTIISSCLIRHAAIAIVLPHKEDNMLALKDFSNISFVKMYV